MKIPRKKFNRYVFLACFFRTNFVVIRTSLGYIYFKLVKSLNCTIKIHGDEILLTNPPTWIDVHFVNIQPK